MIKPILSFFTLMLLICLGCRHTIPDTYKKRQVAVGSGGGFTGMTTTYYLLGNGKLFSKTNRDTTYTALGKLKALQRKQLFSAILDTCQIKTTPYDQPGNVSRFIVFRSDSIAHRVTWATGDSAVPASYPKFYQSFMAMLPPPDQRN